MNAKKSERIFLPVNYEGKVFNSNHKPFIDTYFLETETCLPVIVICPGGSYDHVSVREGEPVAKKFNSLGFHAIVLNYSIAPMEFPAALCDLAECIATVRKNASEWKIDSKKIVVCGFSAGGHLAASLGCYWKNGILQDLLPYTPEQTKADFLVLCYPVITADLSYCHEASIENVLGKENLDVRDFVSLENHVDETFPQTFMWHTFADMDVPVENSLFMANALRRENIPFEYHLFERGCHGLALSIPETSKGNPNCQEKECAVWPELVKNWLSEK